MNVFDDGIDEVAGAIRQRLIARGRTLSVHVLHSGKVVFSRPGLYARKKPLPEDGMIGRYTGAIALEVLVGDLRARCDEIKFGRVA